MAAQEPALGNTQTSPSPDQHQRRRNRERDADKIRQHNRRAFGPRLVDDGTGELVWDQEHRFGSCGQPLGDKVTAGRATMPDGSNRGVFAGVETCGSATACLRCAAKVRAERALHIGHVVRAHLDAGGYVLFATFTFSHSADDSAAQVLADLAQAWKTMNKSRRWKRFKEWAGVVHYIRVLEITHSPANGWHPHYHVVILTTRPIGLDQDDPLELLDTREELSDLWFHEVTKLGRDVHPDIGVDLEPIRDEAGIGAYVSKLQLETARGDLKRGRGGSRSVWQIGLDAADGCPRSAALWAEYVVTVKGSRWISTSKGLWEQFGIDERTDEELAEETPDDVEVVAYIDDEVYRAAAKADGQVLTEIRHLVEAGASSEVLAAVLSRRLREAIAVVTDRPGAGGQPTLEWSEPTKHRRPAGHKAMRTANTRGREARSNHGS